MHHWKSVGNSGPPHGHNVENQDLDLYGPWCETAELDDHYSAGDAREYAQVLFYQTVGPERADGLPGVLAQFLKLGLGRPRRRFRRGLHGKRHGRGEPKTRSRFPLNVSSTKHPTRRGQQSEREPHDIGFTESRNHSSPISAQLALIAQPVDTERKGQCARYAHGSDSSRRRRKGASACGGCRCAQDQEIWLTFWFQLHKDTHKKGKLGQG